MQSPILLADKHTLLREGYRCILQNSENANEIHEAASYSDLLVQLDTHPDIGMVLMDLYLPGSEGVESIKSLHQCYPGVHFVVVSETNNQHDIERAMTYGARGYICKTSSGKTALAAIDLIQCGGIYLPPQLLQRHCSTSMDMRIKCPGKGLLTERQMKILGYLADGLSNKVIAGRLGLAPGTVKIHVASIYKLLQINRRIDALRVAQQKGLLSQLVA